MSMNREKLKKKGMRFWWSEVRFVKNGGAFESVNKPDIASN